MKLFPIMVGREFQKVWGEKLYILWDSIAPHDAQAQRNHGGQTLARLAERGGLDATEAIAVMNDRDWQRRNEQIALHELADKCGGVFRQLNAPRVCQHFAEHDVRDMTEELIRARGFHTGSSPEVLEKTYTYHSNGHVQMRRVMVTFEDGACTISIRNPHTNSALDVARLTRMGDFVKLIRSLGVHD